jgi:hypothetical protein
VLLLKLILIYFILAVVLWGLGRFFHGLIYTEVPPNLHWRALAAAGVIWFVALAWPLLARHLAGTDGTQWPITFDDMVLFQNVRRSAVEFKEFRIRDERGKETRYARMKTPRGGIEYREPSAEGRRLPAGVTKLTGIPDKDGPPVEFQKDDRGHYVDKEGRVMTDEEFGSLVSSSKGQIFLNLFGTLLAWAAWFVALWLLLLFQWPHALGFSIPAVLLWGFALNFLKV